MAGRKAVYIWKGEGQYVWQGERQYVWQGERQYVWQGEGRREVCVAGRRAVCVAGRRAKGSMCGRAKGSTCGRAKGQSVSPVHEPMSHVATLIAHQPGPYRPGRVHVVNVFLPTPTATAVPARGQTRYIITTVILPRWPVSLILLAGSEQVHGPDSDKTGYADRVNRYTGRTVTKQAMRTE